MIVLKKLGLVVFIDMEVNEYKGKEGAGEGGDLFGWSGRDGANS